MPRVQNSIMSALGFNEYSSRSCGIPFFKDKRLLEMVITTHWNLKISDVYLCARHTLMFYIEKTIRLYVQINMRLLGYIQVLLRPVPMLDG